MSVLLEEGAVEADVALGVDDDDIDAVWEGASLAELLQIQSQLVYPFTDKLGVSFGSSIPAAFLFCHPSADPSTDGTGQHKHNYRCNKPKGRASKAT